MSGTQETTTAHTPSHIESSKSYSVLDLETEVEKAKASLTTLGRRILELRKTQNTSEQKFGDKALIAELQTKFVQEKANFDELQKKLDESQHDSEAAFQTAVLSLLSEGNISDAPLLELTANNDTNVPALPLKETGKAETTPTEDKTPPATPAPATPVTPNATPLPATEKSTRTRKDSYLNVERAEIQQGIHEKLLTHFNSGKDTYIEIPTLLSPFINRAVAYKDYDLIDENELRSLAETAHCKLEINQGKKGKNGNRKGYRYSRNKSDNPPPRDPKNPDPLRPVTYVPDPRRQPTNGSANRSERPAQPTTVFNQPAGNTSRRPTPEKSSTPAHPKDNQPVPHEQLSYTVIKSIIADAYSNYSSKFKELTTLQVGEISTTRAGIIFAQLGLRFPNNALRDYNIATESSGTWMLTAPQFVAIYYLLMEHVKFDEFVADAFKEVKAEELAKVAAEIPN